MAYFVGSESSPEGGFPSVGDWRTRRLAFVAVATLDFALGLQRLWSASGSQPEPQEPQVETVLDTIIKLQHQYPEAFEPPMTEDSWTADIATPTCCHTAAIATPVPQQLLLPPAPALEVVEHSVKVKKGRTKKTKTKAPSTVTAGLTEMNAEQLRKLCTAQDIKWRNVHGKGKHLNKAEMIVALTA